ncbi:MAG TPA: hypothetical protein VF126_17850 [Acidobacteriaceae bacterium]
MATDVNTPEIESTAAPAQWPLWRRIVFRFKLHDAMTNAPAAFAWQRPDAQHLIFIGTLGNRPTVIRLSRFDEQRFLLTHRGFHWISEYPYNW